jgi:hypothetical protein
MKNNTIIYVILGVVLILCVIAAAVLAFTGKPSCEVLNAVAAASVGALAMAARGVESGEAGAQGGVVAGEGASS